MARELKPQLLWGVTYVNSPQVMPDTIRRTRVEAIKACCEQRGSTSFRHQWNEWRKRGCRAVRVEVRNV
jgi:hypothetical protein